MNNYAITLDDFDEEGTRTPRLVLFATDEKTGRRIARDIRDEDTFIEFFETKPESEDDVVKAPGFTIVSDETISKENRACEICKRRVAHGWYCLERNTVYHIGCTILFTEEQESEANS